MKKIILLSVFAFSSFLHLKQVEGADEETSGEQVSEEEAQEGVQESGQGGGGRETTPPNYLKCGVEFHCVAQKTHSSKFISKAPFSEGLAIVEGEIANEKKQGYINEAGKLAIPLVFELARPFSEGLAAVRVNDLWGYVDREGNWIIEPKFEDAYGFSEGLAGVQLNGQWGFIDKNGKWMVEALFDTVGSFFEGLARVEFNNSEGIYFINTSGKIVINLPDKGSYREFSEDKAVVCNEDICFYINRQGERVFPTDFEWARSFSEGLAAASVNGFWGFIDKSGDWAIEPQFTSVGSFSEGLAAVRKEDGHWKYINTEAEIVINPESDDLLTSFHSASDFSEGLALVSVLDEEAQEKVYGYINRYGKWVIEPSFAYAEGFSNGYAVVAYDDVLQKVLIKIGIIHYEEKIGDPIEEEN